MKASIEHINPDGLFKSPAFSQVVTTEGKGKTIYVGGQNSVNSRQEIIGKGDIQVQTAQVIRNIQTALDACGASIEHVVKYTIYIVHGQDVNSAFQTYQKLLGTIENPPAISGVLVSGLTNPNFLIEIDAIAFIPE